MRVKNFIITAGVFCFISILAADTRINYTTTNLQLFPKVTYTDGGNYLFTWISNHAGQAFEIYSRAASYSGSDFSMIGSQDYPSSNSTPTDGHRLHAETVPSIDTSTNDTGAIVAWIDHKSDSVYVTRVASDGIRDYTPKQVHPAAFMTPPEMCSDGAGGAIIDKILINDIIVNAVLKEYNKPQTKSPIRGSRQGCVPVQRTGATCRGEF